jgi:sugar phosphate isomerase/epimerase
MKPGVMDTVIGGKDPLERFTRAARSGFSGVEVVLARAALLASGDAALRRLAGARDATGLAIPSLVLGEHNGGGLADPDPSVRAAAEEDVRRAIDWAVALGADVILVPFFLAGELVSEEHVERAAGALRALCPLAAERGVRLCYEGTLPARRVRRLAADVGSDAFGCYFDLANPVPRGYDTATELRALGDLVRRVHLKDARVKGGDCHPGLGLVDFAASAAALDEIGYDDWLVLETPPGPEALVRRDLSFARTVFPSLTVEAPWPRLGAFSYEFAAGDWEGLGRTFADLGLESVQLGGPLLHECVDDPDGIEPAMGVLAEHGVAVAGLAGYRNLVAPAAAAREAGLDVLARCLELAPRFGTSVVATETGTRSPGGDWTDDPANAGEEAWDVLLASLERLLPVAERAGSILALEAHQANVLKRPGQLLALLDRFPTDHLQIVCDPYNFASRDLLPAVERLTQDLLAQFEPHFVLAHLKDVAPEGDGVGTPEFGTGVFPQPPYLEFLRTVRPDLPLILEHLPLEHVAQAVERVRTSARL